MIKTFYNDRGNPIGLLNDDLIFRKCVEGSKHLLKVMDAWGIDKNIVDELGTLKCKEIRIKDKETSIIYCVEISRFMEYAVERNFVGSQLFLPKKYWTTKKQ